MQAQICFFLSIVLSSVVWASSPEVLIWPELSRRGRNEALRPLLMFHSFRFVGLAFLVPGVVSPDLPTAFAEGAAYGDIVAAALALLTLTLLPGRLASSRPGCSICGAAPISCMRTTKALVWASSRSIGRCLLSPNVHRAALLITHGIMFWLLLRNRNEGVVTAARRLA